MFKEKIKKIAKNLYLKVKYKSYTQKKTKFAKTKFCLFYT